MTNVLALQRLAVADLGTEGIELGWSTASNNCSSASGVCGITDL